MSPNSPDSDPAKGRRQFPWLLVVAGAALIPVLSLLFQKEAPLPAATTPPPLIAVEAVHPAPAPTPMPKPFEPVGDVEAVAAADENSAEPEMQDSDNASRFYRKAFVAYAMLSDEEKALLRRPAQELPAEKAAALFKRIQPIMELLRSVKDEDHVEWKVVERTYDKPLPHLARARDLGMLAVWSADYRFASNPAEALVDLWAQARLGASLGESISGWLTHMSMESLAGNMLRQHSGQLTEATTSPATDFLESTAVTDNISRAFKREMESLEALAKALKSQSPDERSRSLELIRARFQPTGKIDPTLATKVQDDAWLEEEVTLIRDRSGQIAEEMQSSPEEYASWWEYAQQLLRKGDHPLAALVLPGFSAMRARLDHYYVERSMLLAGLSIIRDEEENAEGHNDPYVDKPFFYTQKSTGFELRSHFKEKGKPMVMTFVRPKVLAETGEPEP